MYWVLIVAVVVLLFALVRFLGSAFGGKRQSSSKVVCSLGYNCLFPFPSTRE